jgi:tRNA G46 methylase TrmB
MKNSVGFDILLTLLLLDVTLSFCALGRHESNLKYSTTKFCVRNTAISTDSTNYQVNDESNVVDNDRISELERRRKKEQICRSMPRSQKWFKAKQQHVSPNQKRIFNEYWPIYGINLKYGTKVVPHELFPNISASCTTPVCLDIGFGTGDSIVGMSQQNKDKIYLGCEIHRAGISIALGNITTLGIENVKLIRADVTMLLETYLTDRCLDEVCIFFPDPWVNFERDGGRRVVRKGKSYL